MIVFGALSPHPPLLVPEVGGHQLNKVKSSVTGMQRLADNLLRHFPDTIVFFTPHGNVFQDAISALAQPELEGDLRQFGNGKIYRMTNDLELLTALADKAGDNGIPMVLFDRQEDRFQLNLRLDHGILVPLYYLTRAGLNPRVKIMAVSIGLLSLEEMYLLGMSLKECADELGRKVAVVASGDMSHRLKDDGPYSFHPDGPVFDQKIKELLERGDVLGLFDIPSTLRENAGECGFLSIISLMGCLDGLSFTPEVYSYEGPMGVGYLTAGFEPGEAGIPSLLPEIRRRKKEKLQAIKEQESVLTKWARQCLETFIKTGKREPIPAELPEELREVAAAFVSLKKDGMLRGCIGTLEPVRPNLALEIRENAISAATQDHRFPPVEAEELEALVYSVDVLGKPEPINDISQLDPKRYGVIVRSGMKSGVLLPDLPGIESAQEQVRIACQKAGISPDQPFTMERFEVRRYH